MDNIKFNIMRTPGFISESEAKEIEEKLRNELTWEHKEITIYGKKILQPRLIAWAGELPYSYSGATLEPRPMNDMLKELNEKVSKVAGIEFNHILANRYRNGQDSIGFHSDDEVELGKNPIVYSLSFGAPRTFILRAKNKDVNDLKFILGPGDLMGMGVNCQKNFKHGIPKEPWIKEERISLTFRRIQNV